jgi:hypothetical protein
MAVSTEILRGKSASPTADAILKEMAAAIREAGDTVRETTTFGGGADWLILFGVGAEVHHRARKEQIAAGGRVLMFDLGYFDRAKVIGHVRMSINQDHPQAWLDATPPDPSRWNQVGPALRQDWDPKGPIILVGLGRKSRSYLREPEWEVLEFARLQAKYPGRKVIYRPKPGHPSPRLKCPSDEATPIAQLLKGASLVACRHSNVAVDAVVAGVPFEAVDGAAMWLKGKDYTPANRLDFLRRLAWWQWRAAEANQAWAFAKKVAGV